MSRDLLRQVFGRLGLESFYTEHPIRALVIAAAAAVAVIACVCLMIFSGRKRKKEAGEIDRLREEVAQLRRQAGALQRGEDAPEVPAAEPALPGQAAKRGAGRKAAVALCVLALLGAGGYAAAKYYFIPSSQYQQAQEALSRAASGSGGRVNDEQYALAIELFTGLGDYQDSAARAEEAKQQWEEARRRAALQEVKRADRIDGFEHGLAVYRTSAGLYGVIDTQGQVVVEASYEGSIEIMDGGFLCVSTGDGRYGLLDPEGATVLPCGYQGIHDTGAEGLWSVKKADGVFALVDREGQELCVSTLHFTFSEGLAAARDASGVRYIDGTGSTVISLPGATDGNRFTNGIARVVVADGDSQVYEKINTDGEVLSSFVWNSAYLYPVYDKASDRYFARKRNGGLAAIDANTGEAVESWWLDTANQQKAPLSILEGNTGNPSEGRIAVMMWEKEKLDAVLSRYTQTMCYLDTDLLGLVIFPSGTRWSEASDFQDGYAIVRTCGTNLSSASLGMLDYSKNGQYGIINASGEYAVQPQYDSISRLDASYFRVKTNGLWGIVNARTGKLAVAATAEEIGLISDGLIRVKVSGHYGYIDPSFATVIPVRYSAATSFDAGSHLALVKSGSVWCAIDRQGSTVW